MDRLTRFAFVAAVLVLCQLVPVLALLRATWALLRGDMVRAWELAKGYDLLGNPVFNGRAGEYISTRANRARKSKRRWGCVLCKLLDKIDPGHCEKSPD